MFSNEEQEFMRVMGISWYEAMYGIMVKKALELNTEIMELKEKIKKLEEGKNNENYKL